ncbi:type I-E CRISPR-associated endoribonuclease Cas2e [Anaerococcus sp. AGMB09787]|uniref:type I-E CRISPR-associated endoribonuclease Cas2e n=1 Tax=Anaerococcus sp. AGMB09787 TaxID=2922869 RepID=UPI001FAF7CB6|nr:type I-E CRISPR-associated endoribonuclease Cas2e [Anaerococcus sp. AGMB09787]
MPLTLITLTRVSNSLRGDLTKWMQEIAPGVYIGNFNVKVRERLWQRIQENIGDGQATITYAYRNEIGYKFETINTQREAIDLEGLPLVLIKTKEENQEPQELKKGFSKAAQIRKARKYSQVNKNKWTKNYVVLDIETDGLDYKKNNIIEIGAYKKEGSQEKTYQALIKTGQKIPEQIKTLTKIDDKILNREGQKIDQALEKFLDFIGDYPLVGYNLDFDIKFINKALKIMGKPPLTNKKYDLLKYVKKENKYLRSYKLENVLQEYQIKKKVPHRALEDAKVTYELSEKVNKFLEDLEKQ